MQCVQNRLYRCSTARIVLQDGETRRNGPNKWCAPFSLDECTLSSDAMEKCPLPHTRAPCTLSNGMDTWGIRIAARADVIESHTKVASRWSPVRVVNNARLVAANARNQDCGAHQCVLASIRLMVRQLAWIGICENWLWWLHESCSRRSAYPK